MTDPTHSRPTARAAAGPPRLPFTLSIGITGHRVGDVVANGVAGRLDELFAMLHDATLASAAQEQVAFAADPPHLVLVSPLAEGADQAAAEAALAHGFALQVVLPFARDEYAADFADPAAYRALLARSERVFEGLGDRAHAEQAYALAGRATVAHADVLVAVWDGLPARGAGGTAEIVEHALRRGLPVIHLPPEPGAPARLLWSAHDPFVAHSRAEAIEPRRLDRPRLDALLHTLLAPPSKPEERAHLARFQGERESRWQFRPEYPLLLALTGVKRLRSPRQAPYTGPGVDGIDAAYAWADRLAAHYAQTYRSGHVCNFFFGAAAVLCGLAGLLAPVMELEFTCGELACIVIFVVNTRAGRGQEWHRRWLDYRQLAERLRAMTFLGRAGLARPDVAAYGIGGRRWVDWYADGVWRARGLRAGEPPGDAAALAHDIAVHELAPQIAYHRASAASMHHLHHRLHIAGMAVFVLSCLGCATFITLSLTDHEWTAAHAHVFVGLSAGLPAIGTALFGIRVQGDFAGTAARSSVTADHLEAISAALEAERSSLARVADLAEAGARAMLSDLGEWRLSHQQRRIELP